MNNEVKHCVSRRRLLEVILEHSPDIVCLEEVNHYEDFFRPALEPLGYRGVYCAKPKSPCERFGYPGDGTAVFFQVKLSTRA